MIEIHEEMKADEDQWIKDQEEQEELGESMDELDGLKFVRTENGLKVIDMKAESLKESAEWDDDKFEDALKEVRAYLETHPYDDVDWDIEDVKDEVALNVFDKEYNDPSLENELSYAVHTAVEDYFDDLKPSRFMRPEVGQKIKIINMVGEPDYEGREGEITSIDGLGQLHGTWGGLAVIPEEDHFEILEEDYTGTPEERTDHLEYVDDNPTDDKFKLPKNISKKSVVDDCPKYDLVAHTPDEKEVLDEADNTKTAVFRYNIPDAFTIDLEKVGKAISEITGLRYNFRNIHPMSKHNIEVWYVSYDPEKISREDLEKAVADILEKQQQEFSLTDISNFDIDVEFTDDWYKDDHSACVSVKDKNDPSGETYFYIMFPYDGDCFDVTIGYDRWDDPGDYPSNAGGGPLASYDYPIIDEASFEGFYEPVFQDQDENDISKADVLAEYNLTPDKLDRIVALATKAAERLVNEDATEWCQEHLDPDDYV